MIFETLRKDGVHRVGEWNLNHQHSPILGSAPENIKAETYIKENVPGLTPLKKLGLG